jgi:pyruvate dehydrogenase E2 component (dihydrolipoamide acetyltransferase)
MYGLTMPKWGLSMTEGRIVAWLADEGAAVGTSTPVVEVETDKALSPVESPVAGVLRRQVARVGDVIPVAGLLGVIADASTTDSEIDRFVADSPSRFVTEKVAQAGGPATEIVVVQGQPLRYLQRGSGPDAAVLIHGFGGDLDSWLFNHEALAANRAVYALDLPGHGGSSKHVDGGTPAEFAQVLEGFLDAVSLPSAHLVGHSMGGAVALEFALAHPERCLSLVLVASAGLGPEIDGPFIDGFISANRRKDIKPQLDKLFADSRLVGRQLVESVLQYKRLDGVEAALRTIAGQFWPGGIQAQIYRNRLSRLSIPIQVIWGAEDCILPASHSRGLHVSVRTEILPGVGHMVHMEAAARVNSVIGTFWGSIR